MFISNWRMACAVVLAILASGCASLPLEAGRSDVNALLQARSSPAQVVAVEDSAADAQRVEAQIAQWLAAPLTLESAQRVALQKNPRIRASFAQLGLSAADVFEAGRLQNPTLDLSWLLPLGSAQGSKFGASAGLGFVDLLLRPSKRRMAEAEFASAKQDVAAAVLDLLAGTRQAWFDCVAATQRVAVRHSIADAAQLAADLAARYNEAGNITQLELQTQRAEASQARIELQAAQLTLSDARANLQRLLGLGATQSSWTVPEALPELPPQSAVSQADTLQALALEQRLDLAAAHRRVEALRVQRDAIRRYRYVANVQTGAAYEREADDAKRLGPTVQLGLPLFQQGQGAMSRATAELERAEAEVTELENTIQAEVARHLQRMELARLQAEAYREGLIPQREAVVARLKEQADFMLVDSFAVLTARQQEYAAYAGYVDAALTYWTAQTELSRVMGSQRDAEVRP